MATPQTFEDACSAARVGDEVAHGFGFTAAIAGAVAGALIGGAVLAATAVTGGAAVVILLGATAGGGLSTLQIVKGLGAIFNWPEPTTGRLAQGSPNVFINRRAAVRASDDAASSCTGLAFNHPMWPFQVTVAEGSATVYINGKPAARVGSRLMCGAHIKTGSDNTFIGGATECVAFVLDVESWIKTGLEVLGLVALGTAALLAASVGAAALATLAVAGVAVMGGMALLGDLGDRLGSGYRDLLQGVAGVVLLGAGARVSRGIDRSKPEVVAKGKVSEVRFRDVNQRARPLIRSEKRHPTLIAEKVNEKTAKAAKKAAKTGAAVKKYPNGNMADAHAEVGVIQRAYEAGLTKNGEMVMTVKGRKVCDYCLSDVVNMAEAARLKSLTIYELEIGKTLYWEPGFQKFTRR